MSRTIRTLIINIFEDDGDIVAECDDIFSCGIGKTEEEALYELCEHIKMQIEGSKVHKTKIWK